MRFEDVSFAYFRRRTVLESVNFEAAPGDVVRCSERRDRASTIINLILASTT